MALNRYVVRVDPQGQTMAVDILDTSGVSVPAFASPQFAADPLSLPLTITTQTDFCLAAPGSYDVSCKVAGTEVADAGAPKRVEVSDVPVQVVPTWDAQLAATASGGGGATPVVLIATSEVSLSDITDGVNITLTQVHATAGIAVDGVDATKVNCAAAGVYRITGSILNNGCDHPTYLSPDVTSAFTQIAQEQDVTATDLGLYYTTFSFVVVCPTAGDTIQITPGYGDTAPTTGSLSVGLTVERVCDVPTWA